ncbi:MAG: GtrA family protein [Betaproteobacteria bacterium]
MRSIDASALRFLAAGALNTALTYAVYLLLLQWVAYRWAFTLAFALGIAASYALNARYVFRAQATWRSFARFPLIYTLQYILGLVLVASCIDRLGMPTWLAPLVALAVTIPVTYLLSRALFAKRPQS